MKNREVVQFVVEPIFTEVGENHGVRFIPVVCRRDCMDLLPIKTIQALQDVMEAGKDAGKDSLGKFDVSDQVERAVRHGLAYLGGDKTDDHLTHQFTRAMFALATEMGLVQPAAPAATNKEET